MTDTTAPAPEAKAKKANGKPKVARPRLDKRPDEHVITVLRPNAKSGKSAERFNQYHTGQTVKEYVEKMKAAGRTEGQIWADIRWDTDPNRRLINIGPTVIEVPPPPPPKEKKAKAKKPEAVAGTAHPQA